MAVKNKGAAFYYRTSERELSFNILKSAGYGYKKVCSASFLILSML